MHPRRAATPSRPVERAVHRHPDDRPWSIQDARELYSIADWSGGHFDELPDGDLR